MRRALRVAGISMLLLIGILVVAYGVIHVMSNNVLQRRYPVPVVTLVLPSAPVSIAGGQRLATVRGCYLACHGTKAVGDAMLDDFMLGHFNAPNLY